MKMRRATKPLAARKIIFKDFDIDLIQYCGTLSIPGSISTITHDLS
jgi:hypothetical protein